DFNDDSHLDVVIQNNATGEVGIWLMNHERISGFAGVDRLDGWTVAGVGDFTQDNQADMLIQNDATGEVGIWQMNNTRISAFLGVDTLNGWTAIA
ncbi:MAG: VCBS repeat-containing protein, partial [Cyanobacteria bacterium P01_H01_bin.15]